MRQIATPPTPINYAAVIADMEAKRAQLDSAIAAMKVLMEQTGTLAATAPPVPRLASLAEVPPRAFVGLSISAAVRMLLEMMQRRMTIREIMQGLQAGGLKPSKYRNVYAILRQREADKADIIKVNTKWGLAEWNPEIPPRSNLIVPKKQKL
ncbi:MAG: hypothetical protein WA738_19120 [Candidatus Angelobacter sp.]